MKFPSFAYFAQRSHGGGRKDKKQRVRVNNEIRAKQIRVVDGEGGMLGVMDPKEAMRIAKERELDLVEVAPKANPPVCKIIDFGKFKYEQQKKEKLQKKKQHTQQLKELRFKWRIDTHDFNFKVRHARQFLEDGNKVKGTVFFRGREIVHKEVGRKVLENFIDALMDIAKIDQPIKSEGKTLQAIMAPDKGKIKSKGKSKK